MKKILLCLSVLWTGMVSAQPMLVGTIPNASSNFIQGNALVFFTSGDSLMVTDGTAGGTVLVKNGFTHPKPVTTVGDLLYFVSGSGELWRSDGTEPGTYLLRTFSSPEIENIYKSGSNLYFSGVTVAEGRELYRSDGTTGGTILLKDIYTGSGNGIGYIDYLQVGGTLYFQATDATHGKELWKTDGTTGGTVLVKDVWSGTGSGYVNGLWESNGVLYFGGNDGTHGTELWKSDGSSGGTVMVKDVNPGAPNGFVGNEILTANNEVFFVANDATQKLNVWKTDGTEPGTILIKDVDAPFAYSDISLFYTKEDHVYFSVYSHLSGEMSLWETDGTNMGTSLYKVLIVPFYGIMVQRVMNGIFFLMIMDGTNAYMVVTDGTENGSFVKEVGYGGDVAIWNIAELNNHIVFGVTGQSGYFFGHYKSDGTESGSGYFTGPAMDVPASEVVIGNKLFFAKDDGAFDYTGLYNPDNYRQLFSTDLTNTSTFRDEYSISLIGSGNLFNLNGNLLFTTQNSPYDNSRPQKKQLWIHNTNPSQCLSSGSLLREFWDNETGTTIASVPFETSIPDTSFLLTSFAGPSNVGTFYGARYRGYVCAPASGSYRFWISSNDASELWLSTDESPANKVKIASVATFTDPLQWNKFPSQQSASIVLEAGKRYYIEALHKQNAGTDHLAVGWQLPDNTYERPIAGTRLSPYVNQTPTVSVSILQNSNFEGDVTVQADATDADGEILKVEFYINEEKVGEALSAPFTYTIENAYGWYTVWAVATDNSGATARSDQAVAHYLLSPKRFILVDATTDQDIHGIEDNSMIRMFPTRKINIRYNPVGNPGSVVFTVDDVQHRIESVAPFALGGDNNGDYHPVTNLQTGNHWLTAKEYSGSNGTGQLLYTRSVEFTIDSVIVLSSQYISHFTLYDTETNEAVRFMTNSTEIDLANQPVNEPAIVAYTHPATVGSVRLSYGDLNRMENQAPYSLFGDINGNLNSGALLPGFHELSATPYTSNNGGGQEGYSLAITLHVKGAPGTLRSATIDETSIHIGANLRCYPNPASTHVAIELKSDAASRGLVEIYDLSGTLREKLYDGFLSEQEQMTLNWKLAGVAPGVYLVKVTMDESVYTEKLIVK